MGSSLPRVIFRDTSTKSFVEVIVSSFTLLITSPGSSAGFALKDGPPLPTECTCAPFLFSRRASKEDIKVKFRIVSPQLFNSFSLENADSLEAVVRPHFFSFPSLTPLI